LRRFSHQPDTIRHGEDGGKPTMSSPFIPASAGIQPCWNWVPAFAGTNGVNCARRAMRSSGEGIVLSADHNVRVTLLR
jgi:hypothetical protein